MVHNMKITTRLQKYFTWQLTSQIPPEVGSGLPPVLSRSYPNLPSHEKNSDLFIFVLFKVSL